MGGVEAGNLGLQQVDGLQGREGALGAVVVANSSSEAAEFNIKRDFGRGKCAALGIRKVWQGQGGLGR